MRRLSAALCLALLCSCATSYRAPKPASSAFAFTLTPEQCATLAKERRAYRATEQASTYVSGAGSLVSVLAMALVKGSAVPAVGAGVALLSGGVSAFTASQVNDLDSELADGNCR